MRGSPVFFWGRAVPDSTESGRRHRAWRQHQPAQHGAEHLVKVKNLAQGNGVSQM